MTEDEHMTEAYFTIRDGLEVQGEIEDRKSHFIAQIKSVSSEAEAEAFIAEVSSRHHDARHNVPAWILKDGRERCSDDGEPQRTAGKPALEMLRGANLADVCCVVTRYFGGTLLGPGGLIRAYTSAVQTALENAKADGALCEMTLVVPVVANIPYSAYDRVLRMAETTGGKVKDSIFAEDVQLTLAFKFGAEVIFIDALKEYANGEELARAGEPHFSEF